MKGKKHSAFGFVVLWVLLAALALFSCCIGRYPMGVREICGILAGKLWDIAPFWTPMQESLLLYHRLPRILLACLVGCGLSEAGAVYQGVFQNPMAAPDILGASSGAAFGAALAIVMRLGKTATVLLAFGCSLITVFLVICFGNRAKGKRILSLILTGIIMGSLASAGTSFLKLVADPMDQLPTITYWLMGSLNGTDWNALLFCCVPMLLGTIPMVLLRWRINLLTLGDEEAASLGIQAGRLRTALVLCATLVTAASVAVSGLIGWVGLVIPNLARKVAGNDYRRLLPASMLLGAVFLLLVDDLSRCLFAAEIPLGILTALVGTPFFLYLMTKDGGGL